MSIFYCLSKRKRWLLLLLVLLSLQSKAFTQDSSRITVQGNNIPIETALRQIEKQSGFSFVYGKPTLDDTERITVDISGKGFTAVMDALLGARGIVWSFRGGAVVLSRRGEDVKMVADTVPRITVTGTVVDGQGKPLAASTILVKGTMQGTSTDGEGRFSLGNVPANGVLVVSSIGYDNKQVKISGKSTISITLNEVVTELKNVEVVSTGYQAIPRERATGSFYQVENKLINRSVSTNIIDRLNGVVNGLNFQPNAKSGIGQGNRSNITIRGNSTINANSNPLIVIDGFPYDESQDNTNLINNINPNDVESITILRDAAASSIWGARSGNGVIVITTKRGKFNQKTKINFNSNLTISEKPRLDYLKRMSSAQSLEVQHAIFNTGYYNDYDDSYPTFNYFPHVPAGVEVLLAERSGKISSIVAEQRLLELANQDVRIDIDRYLLQNSTNQQYALNLSGGSNNYYYYGSVGYDKNRYSTVRDNTERITARFDNTYKPYRRIEVNSYIVYTQSKTNNNGFGVQQFLNVPYAKFADENGNPLPISFGAIREAYTDTASFPALLNWKYFPLKELALNDNLEAQTDNRIGLGVKYNLVKGLVLDVKSQWQRTYTNGRKIFNRNSYYVRDLVNSYMQVRADGSIYYPVPHADILDNSDLQQFNYNVRLQLNYDNSWGDHNVVAVAGFEKRELTSQLRNVRNYGYVPATGTVGVNIDYNSSFTVRPGGLVKSIPNPGTQILETTNRYVNSYVNSAYSFKRKYTLSISGRMDGSNFFGVKANQRIVPLWSVGGLWDIGQETFYSVSWLPELKLRLTYGFNGNMYNSVTAYPTFNYLSSISTVLSNRTYAAIQTPGNPDLKWEKIKMTNISLAFETTNARIKGNIDLYFKKGTDLIGTIITDPTTGFESITGNLASISGQGLDISIKTNNIASRNIRWESSLLFSYNTDKVLAYEYASKSGIENLGGAPIIGKPLYSIYSYRWAGLDPNNGDPRVYISDTITEFGIANTNVKESDLIFNGSSAPKIFGSLMNTFYYKSISLSFNFIYKFNYYFRRSSINYQSLLNGAESGHADYGMRWRKAGDELITDVPSFSTTPSAAREAVYRQSNILVERGDHIRLQDIRLSYDIGKTNFRNFPFQSIQIYAYANNIGVLWKANTQGTDPDFGDSIIPPPKSIAIGFNIGF